MNKIFLVLLSITASLEAVIKKPEDEQWTKVYKQCFSPGEMRKNGVKKEVLFSQVSITPFTQLIFAWNALRPRESYFTFYAQVRDAATKQWFDYHKMVDWGNLIQRSYFNRSQGSAFHYARLELEQGRKADGFRVKAVAHQKGDLALLKALIISVSDFSLFKSEPYAARAKGLKSCILKGVPRTSQILVDHPKADVLCSPTSTSMVVGTLKRKKIDALSFADYVYDQGLNAFGNWAFNTAHAYELCNQKVLFYPTRLASFRSLYRLLEQRIPVVVSVHGPLKDAPKPYEKGHLLVVIGWDAQRQEVVCHDPAFPTDELVLARYNIHEFVKAWERSRRMTYKPHLIS